LNGSNIIIPSKNLFDCCNKILILYFNFASLPTDVQAEAIPLILGGGDVLMAAETGSGKVKFVI
jgi:hypothetical protein